MELKHHTKQYNKKLAAILVTTSLFLAPNLSEAFTAAANGNFFGYVNDRLWKITPNQEAILTNYPHEDPMNSIIYGKGYYWLMNHVNHIYRSINGVQWERVKTNTTGVGYFDFNTTRSYFSNKYQEFFTTDDQGTRYFFCFSSNGIDWKCESTPFAKLDGNNLSYIHYCDSNFYRFGQKLITTVDSQKLETLVAVSSNGSSYKTFYLPNNMSLSACVGSNVYFYQTHPNNIYYQYNLTSGKIVEHKLSSGSDISEITGNKNKLAIFGFSLDGHNRFDLLIKKGGIIKAARIKELFDISQGNNGFIGVYEGSNPSTLYFSKNGFAWSIVK